MAQGSGSTAVNWLGHSAFRVTTPTGKVSGTIEFKQDGAKLTGTIKSIYGTWELSSGSVAGKDVAFAFPFSFDRD